MLAWFSVWGEVQICIWPSRCHSHSLSLAPVNPDWFYLSGSGSPRLSRTKSRRSRETIVVVVVVVPITTLYASHHYILSCGMDSQQGSYGMLGCLLHLVTVKNFHILYTKHAADFTVGKIIGYSSRALPISRSQFMHVPRKTTTGQVYLALNHCLGYIPLGHADEEESYELAQFVFGLCKEFSIRLRLHLRGMPRGGGYVAT